MYAPNSVEPARGAFSPTSQDHIVRMPQDEDTSSKYFPQPYGAFSEKSIRKQFIRKVYGILSVQLLVTVIIGAALMSIPDVKMFFARRRFIALAVMLMAIIPLLLLTCVESMRRNFPTNFILLSIFTVLEGFAVGAVSCAYRTEIVIYAMVICAASVITITFLATLPCLDITKCGGLLFALLMAHTLMGFAMYVFMMFTKSSLRPYQLGFAILGAFIFMLYLAYDTQLIFGGRKYELSPEEYILGAIMLYLDIINIFMYVLQIMNITGGGR